MTNASATFVKGHVPSTERAEAVVSRGVQEVGHLAGLSLRWVRDGTALAALESQWDRLLEGCETVSPFMRWDWVWRWWRAHEDAFRLVVLVAEERGDVVAIAPFVIGHEDRGNRRGLRQLALMAGIGDAQGERMNLMIPGHRVEELVPLMLGKLEELQGEWDAVRFNRLPAESAILPHLRRALERLTVGFGVLNRTPCRFLNLNFPAWEDVVNTRSRKWRAQNRKLKTQLTEQHGVTFHAGSVSPTGEDVVEALFRLHARQFEGQGSYFIRERALKVHRDLIPVWQKAGRSQLCYLMSGGKIVSMVHVLREGTEAYGFQVGRDPTFEGRSAGTAAWDWAIEQVYRSGAKSLDFLAGDFEYKRRWTDDTRTVLDLEGYARGSWRAQVFLWLRRFWRWVAVKKREPMGSGDN